MRGRTARRLAEAWWNDLSAEAQRAKAAVKPIARLNREFQAGRKAASPFSRRHFDPVSRRGAVSYGHCSQGFPVIVRHLQQREIIASRRAVLRGVASAASVLALGGCSGMGATSGAFDASSLSVDPTLLIATTRKRVN